MTTTNTLLSNVLNRFLMDLETLNKQSTIQAEPMKEQIINNLRIIYDEAAAMITIQPDLHEFCEHAYNTILNIDAMEASLHFSTHKYSTNEQPFEC